MKKGEIILIASLWILAIVVGIFHFTDIGDEEPFRPEIKFTPDPMILEDEIESDVNATTTATSTPPAAIERKRPGEVIGTAVTAENIFNAVNHERYNVGRVVLERDPVLDAAAEARIDDMFTKNYFNHLSPDGLSYSDFVKDTGYQFSYVGENLAIGFDTNQEVVEAWLKSPTHYTNLVKEGYRETGVAVRQGMPCTDKQGRKTTCVLIV